MRAAVTALPRADLGRDGGAYGRSVATNSSGKLGPFVGAVTQAFEPEPGSGRYKNVVDLGPLTLELRATCSATDDRTIKVVFDDLAVILFGVLALHDDITPLSTIGVLFAIGGGLWYARARARMQEFSAAAMAPSAGAPKVHADEEQPSDEQQALLTGEGGGAARVPARRS